MYNNFYETLAYFIIWFPTYYVNSRRNLVTRNSAVSSRQFCSAPEEKKDSSEVSEAVQKLTTENEALSKDLASFKEKCNELDVSSFRGSNESAINVILFTIVIPLQDKFKRSLAETENVRRRLTKQKDDAKLFGIQGFCKDLLNVADILERATESVPKDQIGSNVHLKNLYQGLSMTEGELKNVRNILSILLSNRGTIPKWYLF